MASLIIFNNLPLSLSVKLKKDFREQLFREIHSKFANLKECTRFIECSISAFMNYKYQDCFIPIAVLARVAQICGTPTEDFNKNILVIKKRFGRGIPIKIKLPFYPSPELANLIGHSFGDGHIGKEGRFLYVNKEKQLIENIRFIVKKLFGISHCCIRMKSPKRDCFEIKYPAVIGEILTVCGAIKGNKIKTEFDVPDWVKNGAGRIRSAFLRAVFDDEASIYPIRRKCIKINMNKEEAKIDSLYKFLFSIKEILQHLGIVSGKISISGPFISKSGVKTLKLLFTITGRENLEQFRKHVGFDHLSKASKLQNVLESYHDLLLNDEAESLVTDFLSKTDKYVMTRDVARQLKLKLSAARYHLAKMHKKGRLERSITPEGYFLWSLNKP